MRGSMRKHEDVRRLIGTALDACSGFEFREVRDRLEDAMAAAKRAESRAGSTTPRKRWEDSTASSPMKNLNGFQMSNVLGKIEDMIDEEMEKTKVEGPEGLING